MNRTILSALALAAVTYAQGDLEAKLEEKLKKDFVTAVAWEQDYDVALQKAKDSGKLIFAYFTRSYAP